MTIIPPGYAETIWRYTRTGDSDPYLSTWGVRLVDGVLTLAEATEYVNDIKALLNPILGTTQMLNDVTFRIGQDGNDPLVLVVPVNDAGTSTADPAPQNVAVLVQKRTALGGRRNRGRMFYPFVGEGFIDSVGRLTAAHLTTQTTQWNSILNVTGTPGSNGGGIDAMVVLHNEAPALPAVVTSLQVDPLVATQRRRLRK